MPRDLSEGFQDALNAGVIALSTLILIERRDGVQLGFTDADAPITYGGVTYEPGDGMGASAIQSQSGTGVDDMDIAGVLSSERIREDDLIRGLYDGAMVTTRLIDRANPANGAIGVLVGYLGDIETQDGAFKTEVRSLGSRLKQVVGDQTERLCRCRRVGDAQCKLAMGGTSNGGYPNRVSRVVSSVSPTGGTILFASDSAPTGHYSWGVVKFTSGANEGVARGIKIHVNASGAAEITVRGKFPLLIEVGDEATLDVGCDRLFTTCDVKFGNANNHHGEWHLPGNDKILKVGRQG